MEDKVINVLDKVNIKLTKNDIEACHLLGDNRKTIVRLVNRKHSLEALKNKKTLITVDLTSIGLGKKTNLFFLKTCLIIIIKQHFTAESSDEKG